MLVSNFTNANCLFQTQNKLIYDWPIYAQPIVSLKHFDNPGFNKILDWDTTWGQFHKQQAVFRYRILSNQTKIPSYKSEHCVQVLFQQWRPIYA